MTVRNLLFAIPFVLVPIYLALSSPVQAATVVPFDGGGTCTLYDSQTNGIRLDKCVNRSGKKANDLHILFLYSGLPVVTKTFIQSTGCDLFGGANCFGPEVANGGTWNGFQGGTSELYNPTIWNLRAIGSLNVDLTKVRLRGHWSYDGKRINPPPVPLGETWLLMLTAIALLIIIGRGRSNAQPRLTT